MADTSIYEVASNARVHIPVQTGDEEVVVRSVTGGTFYYGGAAVTTGSSDGNVTVGNSVTLTASKWLISASSTRVAVTRTPTVKAGDVSTTDDLTVAGDATVTGAIEIDGALNHDGSTVGFYGTAPIAKQTGVAVTAGGVHAALVALGLIAA